MCCSFFLNYLYQGNGETFKNFEFLYDIVGHFMNNLCPFENINFFQKYYSENNTLHLRKLNKKKYIFDSDLVILLII